MPEILIDESWASTGTLWSGLDFNGKPEAFYEQYKLASAVVDAVTADHIEMVADELRSGAWPNDETIALRTAQSQRASERVAEVLARNKKHYLLNTASYIEEARHTADREGVELVPPLPWQPSVEQMRDYWRRQDEKRWGPRRTNRTY